MSGYSGKTTNWRNEVTAQQAQAEREAMWGPIPAEVVEGSYDHDAGTITARPLHKPIHNGEAVDMPDLYEVPIDLPRTANAGLTFPIPGGTKVMLLPAMRSMEKYDDENDGAPSDSRSFNLSDMRATIVGGDSLSQPLKNVDPDNTHLRFDAEGKYGLRGSPEGKLKLEGSEGNAYTILAEFMELVASDQLQIAYGDSAGTGHAMQNRDRLMELAALIRKMAL